MLAQEDHLAALMRQGLSRMPRQYYACPTRPTLTLCQALENFNKCGCFARTGYRKGHAIGVNSRLQEAEATSGIWHAQLSSLYVIIFLYAFMQVGTILLTCLMYTKLHIVQGKVSMLL